MVSLHPGTISFWKRTTTSSSGRSTRLGRWQQSHLMPLQTMYQATTCTSKFTFRPRRYKEFSEWKWGIQPAYHLQVIYSRKMSKLDATVPNAQVNYVQLLKSKHVNMSIWKWLTFLQKQSGTQPVDGSGKNSRNACCRTNQCPWLLPTLDWSRSGPTQCLFWPWAASIDIAAARQDKK